MEKNNQRRSVIITEIENKINACLNGIGKIHGEINLTVAVKICDGTIQNDWEIITNFKTKKIFLQ